MSVLLHFLQSAFIDVKAGVVDSDWMFFRLAEIRAAESIVITTPATRKPPVASKIVRLSLIICGGLVWFCVRDRAWRSGPDKVNCETVSGGRYALRISEVTVVALVEQAQPFVVK